ncbi:MAG: peptidoglycan DD-metalloendopeptidase family protein [Treponema sp.]|nr:peptidoglycan DD-metalloendopeptidase family protein [Treponema sp.]
MKRIIFFMAVFCLIIFPYVMFADAPTYEYVTYGDQAYGSGNDGEGEGGGEGGGSGGGPSETDLLKAADDLAEKLDDIEDAFTEIPCIDETDSIEQSADNKISECESSSENINQSEEAVLGDNQAKSEDKNNQAAAVTEGDPVIISEGAYEQRDTDFSTGGPLPFQLNRRYVSSSKIISAFGYGWSSNLDQRIILGIDTVSLQNKQRLEKNLSDIQNQITALEKNLAKAFNISSIYNAESELQNRLKNCTELLPSLEELKKSIDSLSAYTGSSSVNAKVTQLKQSYQKQKTEIEEKTADIKRIISLLPQYVALINSYKQKQLRLQKALEQYKAVLEKSENRHTKNQFVLFAGMESWYEQTGLNTITVIDEDGYPHILFEAEQNSGVWINESDKKIINCRLAKSDATYKLSLADGTIKEFDSAGLIIKIIDRNGNTVIFERNSQEQVVAVETSSGQKWLFEYQGNYITKIKNVRDETECAVYVYNQNKLVSVTDCENDTVTMTYDSDGHMNTVKKCDGSFVQFVYGEKTADGKTLVTSTVNEEGFAEYFEYDRKQKCMAYTDHDGNQTIYHFDDKHRTICVQYPDGSIIKNEYDESGNLIKQNTNGCVTRFFYDEKGNKIRALYDDSTIEEWTWDSYNLQTSWKDRDGVLTEFIRDGKGNLTEYRCGGQTVFSRTYDSKGQIVKNTVYGSQPVITNYFYDSFGNITCITKADSKKEYEYDNRNRLKKTFENEKLISEYTYKDHKIIKKDYNGLVSTYCTNGRKDLVEVEQKDCITGSVHTTKITYDKRHLPLKVYIGDDKVQKLYTSYVYTKEGKLKAQILHDTNQTGNWITIYEYYAGQISEKKQFKITSPLSDIEGSESELDSLLRLAGENVYSIKCEYTKLGSNGKLLSLSQGDENQNLFEYDSYGRLVKTTDANGQIKQMSYSGAGRRTGSQSEYGGWYEYSYNSRGLLSAQGEKGKESIRTEYYPDGSIKSETNRYGISTLYNYDKTGLVSSILTGNKITFYEYDSFQRVTDIKVVDSRNKAEPVYCEWYEYFPDDRGMTVIKGEKYKTTYSFDAFGNVVEQKDANGNTKHYDYNFNNQVTASYDGYGNKTLFEYNALGKLFSCTIPDGSQTLYEYNSSGQLCKVTDECGTVYSGGYDKSGRLIKEQTRADSEKTYEYDKGGRIVKVLCAGEIVQSFSYSKNQRTVTVTDGNGENYIYNYDDFGRLTDECNRLGFQARYFYDQENQLQKQIQPDECSAVIIYSADRTVHTVQYSDGSENYFVYDVTGNIVESGNAFGKTIYEYDKAGYLVFQKEVSTGEEINYIYDDAGNRTHLYSSNRETLYVYGKNNEVTEVFDNRQRIKINLEYDSAGREIKRSFANGISQNTFYDRAGRVTLIIQKSAANEIVWAQGYVYGQDGKRIMTVDDKGRVTKYEYNRCGQLAAVWYPYSPELEDKLKKEAMENGLAAIDEIAANEFLTGSQLMMLVPLLEQMQYGLSSRLTNLQGFVKESFEYDRNGNRTKKTNAYGTISYVYDSENRLLFSGVIGKSGVEYSYDKNGNLLVQESELKKIHYVYNSQNRLNYCEVTDKVEKTQVRTAFAYDAFGRRTLVQNEGTAPQQTIYDGFSFDVLRQCQVLDKDFFLTASDPGLSSGYSGKPTGGRYRYLSETSGTKESGRYRGTRTTFNVNGTLAAQSADYEVQYLSTDLCGSIVSVSDSHGYQLGSYTYDAFGSLLQNNNSSSPSYGYLGKPYDPLTNLYNYGYRDYTPSTSRFTTPDPLRDGPNWFTYCNNDPINFVDLWGLCASDKAEVNNGVAPPIGLTWDDAQYVTSPWGERESFVANNGKIVSSGHNGIDYGADEGTRINAVMDGTVTKVELNPDNSRGYGIYVEITHDNGSHTLYAHQSKTIVTEGQSVEAGQKIGEVGSTGKVTGPHLHLGYDGNGDGKYEKTNQKDNPDRLLYAGGD